MGMERIDSMIEKVRAQLVKHGARMRLVSSSAVSEANEPVERGPRIQLVSPTSTASTSKLTHEYNPRGSMDTDRFQKHHVPSKHFGFAGSSSSTLPEVDEASSTAPFE